MSVKQSRQTDDSFHNNRTGIVIIVITILLLVGPFMIHILLLPRGFDSYITGLKPAPQPQSQTVNAQREATRSNIDRAFSDITSKTKLVEHVASSTHDSCRKGEDGHKRYDGFAYRCELRITKFYGFNGTFRSTMIELEEAIYSTGWKYGEPSENKHPLKEIMEKYYDSLYGKDNLYTTQPGDIYLVSNLPTPNGYFKNTGRLDIAYAERGEKNLDRSLETIQYNNLLGSNALYDKKDPQNIQEVFNKITKDNRFVVAIAIQQDYFYN